MAASPLNAAFPSGPLLEDTGELSPSWRGFFMSLYSRTGGSTGVSAAGIPGDLTAETAARQAADTALQGNITAEATARASGDATNANAITAEQNARMAVDGNIYGAIDILHIAGNGVPTVVKPSGTVYSRRDGVLGARLYVSQGGGAWLAIAGV